MKTPTNPLNVNWNREYTKNVDEPLPKLNDEEPVVLQKENENEIKRDGAK